LEKRNSGPKLGLPATKSIIQPERKSTRHDWSWAYRWLGFGKVEAGIEQASHLDCRRTPAAANTFARDKAQQYQTLPFFHSKDVKQRRVCEDALHFVLYKPQQILSFGHTFYVFPLAQATIWTVHLHDLILDYEPFTCDLHPPGMQIILVEDSLTIISWLDSSASPVEIQEEALEGSLLEGA
jgi:hypothetical protein